MERIMILEKKKYYGKMYPANKLPKGYTVKGNPAFSDFFLMHRGKAVSRLLFIRNKQTGNKWYNYTFNKKETPRKALLNEKKSERYFEKIRKLS